MIIYMTSFNVVWKYEIRIFHFIGTLIDANVSWSKKLTFPVRERSAKTMKMFVLLYIYCEICFLLFDSTWTNSPHDFQTPDSR